MNKFIFRVKNFVQNNHLQLGLLTLLILLTYLNALDNAFVSDDIAGMAKLQKQNPGIGDALTNRTFTRSLAVITIYKIFGLQPVFFRLINLFFHLGTTVLFYGLVLKTAVSLTSLKAKDLKPLALISSAVFAVHPLASESVAWISAGAYPQYAFFLLLGLLLFILAESSWKLHTLSLISFGLAVTSSEKAIFFFAIPLLYVIANRQLKKNWRHLVAPVVLGGATGVYYLTQVGNRLQQLSTTSYTGTDNGSIFLKIPIAITKYLELYIWPKTLTLYHSELSMGQLAYSTRVLILILFMGFVIWMYRRNKYLFFWLSTFVVSLFPTLTPWQIGWVVAERYVYFGLLGLSAVVGYYLTKLRGVKKYQEPATAAIIILITLLLGRTFVRNIDWDNRDNLWIATGKASPSDPKTHNNLGDVYGRHGDLERSAQEFKIAIKLNPQYADAYHNLANTYRQMGRVDEAIENYQKALELNPRLWQSHQQLGAVYFEQEKYDQAIEEMRKALKIVPQNPDLYVNLAVIYLKLEDSAQVEENLSRALQLDPKNQRALQLKQQIISEPKAKPKQ